VLDCEKFWRAVKKHWTRNIRLELDVNKSLFLSGAVRYENYSDFGSTFNWKLAGIVKLSDNVNLRAAASTGFRAPSLAQLNFNTISTNFISGVPF